jgi:hypothetical protein
VLFCTTDLPRCSKDIRFWCVVCGTYAHIFKGLQVHNKGKKHYQQLLDLGLPNEHSDLDYNMNYSNVIFYVTMFSKNHFPIKYEDPLTGFATLDYFRGKNITIPMCVRKFLNVRVNCRFSKKDIFDYNCTTSIKNLSQIHDYVLLVEDEIVTGIIVFDDIPIKECAHIEEISRGIYTCGGSVQRGPMKKDGKMVMCDFRKNLGKKIGAPGEFNR